jgi:hypothetical protein
MQTEEWKTVQVRAKEQDNWPSFRTTGDGWTDPTAHSVYILLLSFLGLRNCEMILVTVRFSCFL